MAINFRATSVACRFEAGRFQTCWHYQCHTRSEIVIRSASSLRISLRYQVGCAKCSYNQLSNLHSFELSFLSRAVFRLPLSRRGFAAQQIDPVALFSQQTRFSDGSFELCNIEQVATLETIVQKRPRFWTSESEVSQPLRTQTSSMSISIERTFLKFWCEFQLEKKFRPSEALYIVWLALGRYGRRTLQSLQSSPIVRQTHSRNISYFLFIAFNFNSISHFLSAETKFKC